MLQIFSNFLTFIPVDCEWSEWKIGECSKQCGGGRRINKREQNVLAAHGGRECSGPTELDEPCNTLEFQVIDQSKVLYKTININFCLKYNRWITSFIIN